VGRRDPASLAQQAIWLAARSAPAGSAHHVPLTARLEGELDVRALVDACEAAVARHPILGGAFQEHGGVPWVGPAAVRPHVAQVDLSTSPAHRVPAQVADLVRRETARPFDLCRGPLARFTLCRLARRRFLLLFVAHRLVFDEESKDVLVRDLTCLYGAFAHGAAGHLPPLPPLREQLAGEHDRAAAVLAAARELWSERWREPAGVALPGLARVVPGAGAGDCLELSLTQEVDNALDGAARALGASRQELLVGGLVTLLHRYGNEDAVVGLDVSTRTPRTRDCVGPFANELPLAVRRRRGGGYADVVRAVRAELRDLHAVREVPLAWAVPGVGPRLALTPVSMSCRRRSADPGFPGLDTTVEWTACGMAARNALHVQLVDGPGAVAGNLSFGRGAIDRESVARIAGHLAAVLEAALADPDAALADLAPPAGDEREQVAAVG